MRCTQLVLSVALSAVFASDAHAWCNFDQWGSSLDDDSDEDPPAPFTTSFLYDVSDDCEAWKDTFATGNTFDENGFLSCDPSVQLYAMPVVQDLVDSASQAWSRYGRPAIKIGFRSFADVDFTVDDVSTITVQDCESPGNGGAGAAPNPTDGTCDIEVARAYPGALASCQLLSSPVCPVGFTCNFPTMNCIRACTTNADCPPGTSPEAPTGWYCEQSDGLCRSPCTWQKLDVPANSVGFHYGAVRILRHEMGHCLGLGHHGDSQTGEVTARCTNFDAATDCTSNAQCPAGTICELGECYDDDHKEISTEALMHFTGTDVPSGDDIEGVQKVHRFDLTGGGAPPTSSLIPRREIAVRYGLYSPSNAYSFSGSPTNLGVVSIYPPRIACDRSEGSSGALTDCVMIRAHSENEVRFSTLINSGTTLAIGQTIAIVGASTRLAPDVAIDGSTAVAVVARIEPSDPIPCTSANQCSAGDVCAACGAFCPNGASLQVCRTPCTSNAQCNSDESCGGGFCSIVENHKRSVSVHKFARATNGTWGQDGTSELAPTSDHDITYYEPRITAVHGAFTPAPATRFLVMTVARNRSPHLFLSNNSNSTFIELTEQAPPAGVLAFAGRRVHDSFDIACPNHAALTATAMRRCRVVYGEYANSAAAVVTPSGQLSTCTIDINGDAATYKLVACTTEVGATPAAIVSLSDYGKGVPTDQRTAAAWLFDNSRPTPHISSLNSRISLWNAASVAFTPADLISSANHGNDTNACTTFGGGDNARSYFGGTSLDYCEDCDRVVHLYWGVSTAGDVPPNLCY